MAEKLAFIGFGEAASTFAGAPVRLGAVSAFDTDPSRMVAMASCGVDPAKDAQTALESADAVLSLVTADQALVAATSYARFLKKGSIWIDMNSVAPETKRRASEHVVSHSAFYVDAAILAPVRPSAMDVPILLSGPAHCDALKLLAEFGFTNVSGAGSEIGKASTIKMVRSIMVKGIEALTAEMMEAASAANVVDEVLSSLNASAAPDDWRERATYNLERMATHGARRASEMEEVVATLLDLDVEPAMARATVFRQKEAAMEKTSKRDVA